MLDQDAILELLREARAAKEFAYAPYSGFRVGACVLMEDGRIFSGCNVEHAAYGDTICAERTAILKAVSNGSRTLVAIAITGDSAELTYPCGSCRQVIHEFAGPDTLVVVSDRELHYRVFPFHELLPGGFGRDQLRGPEKEERV